MNRLAKRLEQFIRGKPPSSWRGRNGRRARRPDGRRSGDWSGNELKPLSQIAVRGKIVSACAPPIGFRAAISQQVFETFADLRYVAALSTGMETLRYRRLCLGLVVMAAVAGCAPTTQAPPASNTTGQPATTRNGTILSMRKVTPPAGQDSWRKLLVGSGDMQRAGDSNAAPLTEFIVRTDDGSTLSIVQANALGLHTGDRVVILRDTGAHLARPDAAEQRQDNRT
jgi:outer membrane lipoprotein SlyB